MHHLRPWWPLWNIIQRHYIRFWKWDIGIRAFRSGVRQCVWTQRYQWFREFRSGIQLWWYRRFWEFSSMHGYRVWAIGWRISVHFRSISRVNLRSSGNLRDLQLVANHHKDWRGPWPPPPKFFKKFKEYFFFWIILNNLKIFKRILSFWPPYSIIYTYIFKKV